mmetsp:Transcript_24187/g.27566  ORF Transcript_24187/g.27566 Transcript_24187/m.27566 type:complete len:144 (-) Transcript_24187:73-504(-)|eukprot:CAMPEP_0194129668 /NCGR_PEP_ID=MMETSP0152-20130528/872_1 /TAXON_ID=1049557 /ORGANISM="Thalassiothrix antarctica, Strain L6-D1" /LENGTH=143 /DNA_ID=CAMNT_0038823969 /DNA_START=76 /DNA_END=507 /DNA_ORIENTATION=+
MKVFAILMTLLVGASSFAIPKTHGTSRTALSAWIPEEDMTADHLEIKRQCDQWNAIRHYSREEAAEKLDGELLEAYNRYYKKYDEDMEWMVALSEKLNKIMFPPQVPKKGKKQKKREKFARQQAYIATRLAGPPKVVVGAEEV